MDILAGKSLGRLVFIIQIIIPRIQLIETNICLTGNQPLTDLKLNNRGILLEQKEQTNDVLVIDPITMQHSDVYSCLVNNSHTFDQQRVLLQVTGKFATDFP